MQSIFIICALFLVLPCKLAGETTLGPSSTRQHEDTYKDQETTIQDDKPTIFPTKTIDLSLKPNGEETHSQSSTMLHKSTSEDHQTTPKGDEPTIFSTKIINLSLKPNGEATYSPGSIRLHKGSSEAHETTPRGDKPTISFVKNQNEYTTEGSKNVLSSKLPPQTSAHQHVPSTSYAEHLTQGLMIYTGELMSSSHLTKLPQKKTDLITVTPLPQNMSEEVLITKDEHQTTDNFKSTNKGLDRHTQVNKTTRSAESFKVQSEISTHFQTKPEVITNQTVQIKETLTTKWSSLPQEKESTHLPIINTTYSNGTMDTISKERIDTTTYPLNTSPNTGLSTGQSPTVNTDVGTTASTTPMDKEITYKITTEDMIKEGKHHKPNSETIPTIQRDNTKTTVPKDNNNKRHPGPIVASLIGSILFLMFVAFVLILVRNRKVKKKQMENPDWAGPSPFIEADIHPNLPAINEDGPFNHQESKRFSLHSFLPQQLSKRFSMLSPTDEEIPLEDTQASSTFGLRNVQPLNGRATPDQIQTHETKSPTSSAELSSDSNVPETVNIPPAPENNENIQTTTKLDEEIIPSPPAEIDSATPAPFEDVDLNHSLDKNIESTTPTEAIHNPSPPPLAPS